MYKRFRLFFVALSFLAMVCFRVPIVFGADGDPSPPQEQASTSQASQEQAPIVQTSQDKVTPSVPSSSSAPPAISDSTGQTTSKQETTPNNETTSPLSKTEQAMSEFESGNLDIRAISVKDFVKYLEKKMFEVVMGVRAFSIPYAIFVLTIGGLVLMMPFKVPMKRYLGMGIIGFGLLGFVLIWMGPVILGIAKGLATTP